MSKIKLNAASGGSVSFKPPTQTTSSADVELTLPVNDGDNGQFIQTNGSGVLTWATPNVGNTNSLQVLEKFYGVCDGRSYATANGTVSTESVTTYQALSDAYATMNGSTITYQPPTGTTEVIYEYRTIVSEASNNNRLLYGWYVAIDNSMITQSKEVYMNAASGYVHELAVKYGFRVNTGGTDNNTNGDRAGLTSMTIKTLCRRWDSSYAANAHYGTYFPPNSTGFAKTPQIGITAIGSVS